MNNNKPYQTSVFDYICWKECEAYAACGGYRKTSPCGCVWKPDSKMFHQCHKCYIICRERGLYNQNKKLLLKDFPTEVSTGLALEQVSLQQVKYSFPIHIPSYTHRFQDDEKFENWVAVDVRAMFNCRVRKGAVLNSHFAIGLDVRQYLHVSPHCGLIAVLNGTDRMLESVWGMSRRRVFATLASMGFSACTAPTFSVTALTTENTTVPYSHHTAMLMRHHRVLSEIDEAGLCSVPNLYWLDNDKREIDRWSKWLRDNPDVYVVSRDFTSTKQWTTIEPKITELIELLAKAERSFQILIIGTGARNACRIVERLTKVKHKVSIVTAAPTQKALRGTKYIVNEQGKLSDAPSHKSEHSFSSLMRHNLKLFVENLERADFNK